MMLHSLRTVSVAVLMVLVTHSGWSQRTITATTPASNARNVSTSLSTINLTISGSPDYLSIVSYSDARVNGAKSGKHTITNFYGGSTYAVIAVGGQFAAGEEVTVTVKTGTGISSPYTWTFTTKAGAGASVYNKTQNYTTGADPNMITSADVDADGDVDLITANQTDNAVSVFLNNGDGTFASKVDYAAGSGAYSVTAADVDQDGDVDLVTANVSNSTLSVLKNNGSGTFAAPQHYYAIFNVRHVSLSDVDGDGDPDAVITGDGQDSVNVSLNNGSGVFQAPVHYDAAKGFHVVADVDGDHDLDIVVGSFAGNKLSVLKNNGDGTFGAAVENSIGTGTYHIAAGDVDGDGDIDIAGVNMNSSGVVTICTNNGTGAFSSASTKTTGSYPNSVALSDVDGDGDLDLVTVNNGSNTVSILKNDGSATFSAKTDYATTTEPQFLTVADFDGDKDLDLAVSSYNTDVVKVMTNVYQWTVNSTSDVASASPGSGTAQTAGGQITLRSAIQEARANGLADDIITVPAGTYTLSISGKEENAGATGDLDLVGNLVINGAGESSTIIDGNSIDRVFHISDEQSAAVITIKNLKITGGDPTGDSYHWGGGGILMEDSAGLVMDHVVFENNTSYAGALNTYTDAPPKVTITNCTFSNNYGENGAAAIYGSYNGSLRISNSTFTGNFSPSLYGGAIYVGYDTLIMKHVTMRNNRMYSTGSNVRGGALYVSDGVVSIDSCEFESNSVTSNSTSPDRSGGSIAIYNSSAALTISNSSFRTDTAGIGGSIYMSGTPTVSISGCTFRSGVANERGGAIGVEGGTLVITNSSLDSNWCQRTGGAIYVYGGTLRMTGDTLRHNSTNDEGLGDNGGGIYVSNAESFSLKDSYLSDNYSYKSGGGLFSDAMIDTLSNVRIRKNTAGGTGGGVSIGYTDVSGGGGDRAVTREVRTKGIREQINSAMTGTKSSVWSNVTVDSNTVDVSLGSGGGGGGDRSLTGPGGKMVRDRSIPSGGIAPAPIAEGGTLEDGRGGGVYDNAGGLEWNNGSLRGNTASYSGGGFYFNGDANSTIQSNVLISGNKANNAVNQIGISGATSSSLTTAAPIGSSYDSVAGSALSFDGTDDYAYANNPYSGGFGTGVTVEMWVKPTALPASGKMVIYSSNGRTVQYGIDSSYRFFARFEQGYTDLVYIKGSTVVSANQWYHLAVSVKSGDSLILYVNGDREAACSVSGSYGGTNLACLGKMYHGDPQLSSDYHYFTGVLDEVRVWNSVRTASQIRTYLHRTMTSAALTNAALYLQMNENTGAMAYDYSNAKNFDLDLDGSSYQPSWVASTAPVGGGTASSSSVAQNTTGVQNIGNVKLDMSNGFDNPTDVVVSEVSAAPSSFPTNYNSSVGGKYFIIDAFPYPSPGSFTTTLTLNYGSGVLTDVVAGNYILYKRGSSSSGSWTSYGPASSVNTTTGDVTWTNITSFSQAVVVNSNDALPVELTSFTAEVKNAMIELRWATASERDNARFDVERQSVAKEGNVSSVWTKIGAVEGHGTTNTPQQYSFTDNSARGSVRYRLKQVDTDGKVKYSRSVETALAAPLVFALSQNYPNPFNPSTTLEFTIPSDGMVTLKVYNTLGQEVATLVNGMMKAGEYHSATFDASTLSTGVYFARLTSGSNVQLKKMMLMK